MTGPLRVLFSCSALFTCASLLLSGCAFLNTAPGDNKPKLQEPLSEDQPRFPAELLSNLQVVVDASPVFLEPKRSASTFGPLTRGEALKWLEQAIEAGWSWRDVALKDPIWESLCDEARFLELMAQVKTKVDRMCSQAAEMEEQWH